MRIGYDIIEDYGRGAGYTSRSICNRHNHQSNGCEKCGLLFYPKCRDGYHPVGCNVCDTGEGSATAGCSVGCVFSHGPDCEGPGSCYSDFNNCMGACCSLAGFCFEPQGNKCKRGDHAAKGQFLGQCADGGGSTPIPATTIPPPTNPPPKQTCIPKYGNCSAAFDKCCDDSTCRQQNQWYSQCCPKEKTDDACQTWNIPTPPPQLPCITKYGNCSEAGAKCCDDSVCRYKDAWYAQCCPKITTGDECQKWDPTPPLTPPPK